jgi:phosphate transport system substrate-binding protein
MNRRNQWLATCLVGALAAVGCLGVGAYAADLKGDIKIDGSSTVFLITEAMAKAFKVNNPNVNITVGLSGTGGGFKKFYQGETDINDASRQITKTEIEECQKKGITYTEFQVGWDGITVVVNKDNNWAKEMTVAQLKKIWEPDSKVTKWSDVDPKWPDEKIKLYGHGSDSGTFEFFTEAINGKAKACRTDYESTANPNVIAQGVAGSKFALGFFGLAYFEENKDKLHDVGIKVDDKAPAVLPSKATVLDKSYQPLSRPLFIYVKNSSLKKPEVQGFLEFYLRRGDLVGEAKYIPLRLIDQTTQQKKLQEAIKGLN